MNIRNQLVSCSYFPTRKPFCWKFDILIQIRWEFLIATPLFPLQWRQITSLTIVSQPLIQAQIKESIEAPRYWPFVRVIHRWQVNSPQKGPVTRKMFPFDDVIMANCEFPNQDTDSQIGMSYYWCSCIIDWSSFGRCLMSNLTSDRMKLVSVIHVEIYILRSQIVNKNAHTPSVWRV